MTHGGNDRLTTHRGHRRRLRDRLRPAGDAGPQDAGRRRDPVETAFGRGRAQGGIARQAGPAGGKGAAPYAATGVRREDEGAPQRTLTDGEAASPAGGAAGPEAG